MSLWQTILYGMTSECVCECVYVCVCMCVCKREKERERDRRAFVRLRDTYDQSNSYQRKSKGKNWLLMIGRTIF